jgi:roadblock/LC7 domain-containing protein
MHIALISQSTLVSNTDAKTIADACQAQLTNDFLPAWNMKEAFCAFYPDKSVIPSNYWVVNLLDNPTQAGALGYHSVDNDEIDAFVFAQPTLSNGGVVLYDMTNPQNVSVASVVSHEILEMAGDMYANTYCDFGNKSFALEACDAVQGNSYIVSVDGKNVSVSDFVYMSYFDPQATISDRPFNHLNTLTAPFSIAPGGYQIVRASGPGSETQVFGDAMPEWVKETKKTAFARFALRTK